MGAFGKDHALARLPEPGPDVPVLPGIRVLGKAPNTLEKLAANCDGAVPLDPGELEDLVGVDVPHTFFECDPRDPVGKAIAHAHRRAAGNRCDRAR